MTLWGNQQLFSSASETLLAHRSQAHGRSVSENVSVIDESVGSKGAVPLADNGPVTLSSSSVKINSFPSSIGLRVVVVKVVIEH